MSVIYTRTYSSACPGDLIDNINNDVGIVPTLEQMVNVGGGNIDFYFSVALSGGEVITFDNILSTYTCPVITSTSTESVVVDDSVASDPAVLWSSDKVQTEIGNIERWFSVVGDTGSTSANTNTDTLTIVGVNNISTSITGDTVLIDGAHTHSLTQLSDVTETGPVADNELLAFNNGTSTWINQTAAEAGLATVTDLTTHTGDATIHFTESSIDHLNIQNIGTNSHAQIDTHIADGTIHFTKSSINLNDLGDIVITTPADDEILAYDTSSGNFINQTLAEANINTNTISAAFVPGYSTYTTIQNHLDFFHSAGSATGGDISDNGDQTITVTAGNGFIRTADSDLAEIQAVDWSSTVLGSFTNNVIYHITVTLVGGVPTVQSNTVRPDDNTHIYLGTVLRENTVIHYHNPARAVVANHALHMIQRMSDTNPFSRVSGGIVSEAGTRNLMITSGVFWDGLTKFTTKAWDTTGTDTFDYYYQDGASGFIETESSQLDNTQYDDGSGTLANVPALNYFNNWIYIESDDHISVVRGRATFATLANAQAEQPYSDLPPQLNFHARLIAKVIMRQGTSSFIEVDSAFVTAFTATGVSDHYNLAHIGTNTHTQIDSHIADTSIHFSNIDGLSDVNITTPSDGQILVYNTGTWANQTISLGDELVKVSSNDTTAGYLNGKLVAGAGINLVENNDGSNETLTISSSAADPIVFTTFNADTGTTTANIPSDTLTINGATEGISTSITGDTLTISPSNDLAAIEGLVGTGLAVRTAADTWTNRTITGTIDQITVTDGDGVAGNPILALASNPVLPGTEGVTLNAGTTAQRAVSPTVGETRFNTDVGRLETWDGTQWLVYGSDSGSSVAQLKSSQLAQLSGTTVIPYDDTPPLITEGTQFFSDTMTVGSPTARVVLWFSSTCTVSSANRIMTISLWRDTTLIGVFALGAPSSNSPVIATSIITDTPGAAGTYTYSARVGVSASATWYMGGWTSNAGYSGAAVTQNQYVLLRLE